MLGRIRASDDDFDSSLEPGIQAISGAADTDRVTIPDAHLLFSGEYKRSGSFDLKIVGEDGKSVLIPDYFRSDQRATLQSPDGAALTPDIVEALSGPLAPGQYAQAAHAQAGAQVIGRVATVTGNATVLRNGVATTLSAGEPIQKGDVLQTGSGAKLGVAFVDGSTFMLNAGSRLVVSEMVYEAGGASNRALFTLVDGATNFIAGQTAKTDLKVSTPAVNMGIRGTAVMLDIASVDGRVSVSVIDQRDNQIHQVDIFDSSGVQIGTAFSNGGSWTLTSTASLQVLAQQTGKTPQQIALEFAVLQELLAVYDGAQQYFPTPLPQHTDIDPSHVPVVSAIKVAGTQFLTTFPPLPGPLEVHTFFFNVEPLGGEANNASTTGNTDLPLVDFGPVEPPPAFRQTVRLDEDGDAPFPITPLPDAVPGGVGDDPDAPVVYFGGPNSGVVPAPFSGPQPLFAFGPAGPAGIDPIVFDIAALDALGLTSGGEPVTFTFDALTLTLTGAIPSGDVVIRMAIFDLATGDFGVAILRTLDHPAPPAGADEDELDIPLSFTLIDGNGTQTTGTVTLNIDDDSIDPCFPVPGFVEETDGAPQLITGTLDLEWGADNFNSNSGPIDRSIAFARTTAAANVVATDPNGIDIGGLTSNGAALSYAILGPVSQGAKVYLVAYTGAVPGKPDDLGVVFWASLEDTNPGDWEFELRGPLDHPAPVVGAHFIDLTFSFTATDSDGDPVTGTFTVQVDAAGDICACGTKIDYSSLPGGVFINLADGTRTVATTAGTETADANTAEDRDGVTPPVIGIDQFGFDIVDAKGTDSDDIIIGGSEDNALRGLDGADIIRGGRGDDEIHGGGGNDIIRGGRGFDYIEGNAGDDEIDGGRGMDIILAGAGADTISGGRGNDEIHGEGGDDIIIYDVGDGSDVVFGDGGNDTQEIYGSGDSETFNVNRINLLGENFGAINIRNGIALSEVVPATPGNFEVATRNVEDIFIDTGAGTDVVVVTGTLGGTGLATSTITIEGASDDATDVVDAGGLTSDHGVVFNGGGGDDYFFSSAAFGNDTFDGGGGTDTIDFSFICGCGGGIVIDVSDAGAQNTNYGLDTVIDVENVVGSVFDDTITGSDVANTLTGGSGADTFVFAKLGPGNVDTITDYSGADGDTLDVSSLLDAAFGGSGGSDVGDFVQLIASGSDIIVQLDIDGTGAGGWQDLATLSSADTAGLDDVRLFFENQTQTLTI